MAKFPHSAVIDQCDERAGDLLTHPAGEDRRGLGDEIGFEAVSTRFVEQDTTAARANHNSLCATRCWACAQFGDRTICRSAGHLGDIVIVEHFEADRTSVTFAPGLHSGVAHRHAVDREERANLIVAGDKPIGVRDENAAATIAVAGAYL
jgi:hypothetical protein